jgi:hypothetical protein
MNLTYMIIYLFANRMCAAKLFTEMYWFLKKIKYFCSSNFEKVQLIINYVFNSRKETGDFQILRQVR